MEDFSKDINNFLKYGTYNYQFDVVGNQILNSSSSIFQQNYIKLPILNPVYNNSKINSFYDSNFTEFVPSFPTSSITSSLSQQDAINQISDITYQNTQLQNQLKLLVTNNELNTGSADIQLVKNIILNLRIQLGQGNLPGDFDTVFPYLPLSIQQNN